MTSYQEEKYSLITYIFGLLTVSKDRKRRNVYLREKGYIKKKKVIKNIYIKKKKNILTIIVSLSNCRC